MVTGRPRSAFGAQVANGTIAAMTLALPTAALVDVAGTSGVLRLVAVLVACTVLAAGVNTAAGLGHAGADLRAASRATVQLALVGLVITAVLRSWPLTLAFVLTMVVIATGTAFRRLAPGVRPDLRQLAVLLPVAGASLPVVAAFVGSGLVPARPIAVVPVAGILVGNAMTATTLSGRRALDALHTRYGEFEAGLSIGLERRDAALLVARDDAALALVPGLDQTRTVGLVTLPGAFVGMLLGGASPLQAAAVQLLVLVGLLLVQAVAVAVTLELVARDVVPRRRR